MNLSLKTFVIALSGAFLISCGGDPGAKAVDPPSANDPDPVEAISESNEPNKGVGPISSIEIPTEIDTELASKGEELFTVKCTACHKMDARYVGPALKGVTEKRTPEWIINMIMVPESRRS